MVFIPKGKHGGVLVAIHVWLLWPHGMYVAHQAPLSTRFSRQEYWSGLPFLSPGDLLDPRIGLGSPALQADSLPTELEGKTSCT